MSRLGIKRDAPRWSALGTRTTRIELSALPLTRIDPDGLNLSDVTGKSCACRTVTIGCTTKKALPVSPRKFKDATSEIVETYPQGDGVEDADAEIRRPVSEQRPVVAVHRPRGFSAFDTLQSQSKLARKKVATHLTSNAVTGFWLTVRVLSNRHALASHKLTNAFFDPAGGFRTLPDGAALTTV